MKRPCPNPIAPLLVAVLVWQSCARAPESAPAPQPPTLQAGTWSGSGTPPGGGFVDLSFEVISEGDSLSITMIADFGSFPLHDIRLTEDQLAFWLSFGERIECVLGLQEEGGYAGECVEESGGVGRVTMRPPQAR